MSAPAPVNVRPRVSVVMIFLNAGEFIDEAIQSVMAQTFHGWELLLVDDGSTDGSTAIAREWAERHPVKIHCLEHDGHVNRGMSASRNLGIKHARGEFIALLDADDVWLPDKLDAQLAILDAHPEAAMVYGATQYWHSWRSEPDAADSLRPLGVRPDAIHHPPELVARYLSRQGDTPATCSVLMRRACVQEVGGFEEQFRGMFEDQAFFVKLCLRFPAYVESGVRDRYRKHAGGTVVNSASSEPERFFLEWVRGYFEQTRVRDPRIWSAWARAHWKFRHPLLARLLEGPKAAARAILPPEARQRIRERLFRTHAFQQ